METKKKSTVLSNALPPNLKWDWWREKSHGLFFLCTAVLSSAWDDKFKNFGILHKHVCRFMDPESNPAQRKLLSIFRGSYKTTVLLGLVVKEFCWAIASGKTTSIVYNTATKENAEAFMDDFRQTMRFCSLLHWIFPEIPKTPKGYRKWTKTRVEFAGVKFHVASLDTKQVSRHYLQIINDDLVNDDNAFSEVERTNVLRKWRMQKSILTRYSKLNVGREYDVGTPYHKLDLMAHLVKKVPSYEKFIVGYRMFREDGTEYLTFPEMYTWKDFELIREDQGEEIFSTQYKLEIPDDASQLATESDILEWKFLPDYFYRGIIMDPAGTENKKKNDPSAFLVFDVDERGNLYVVHTEEVWVDPYKAMKIAEKLQEVYDPDDFWVEKEKYSIFMEAIVDRMAPNLTFGFVSHDNEPPEKRVHRLKQYFATHRILFGPNQKTLIRQVLNWGDGGHDDLLMCLAYAVKKMVIPTKRERRERENVSTSPDFEDELKEVQRKMDRYRFTTEDADAMF